MSNSAWDEKVVIKGAGLAEGQYAVTLKDIVREDKVIQFREGLRSNSKGIVGKEYAALTAEQKAIVDAVGDEFWQPRDAPPGNAIERRLFDVWAGQRSGFWNEYWLGPLVHNF